MTTLYLHHTAALNHLAEPGHPERADRIRVIEHSLEQERFAALTREQAPLALVESIMRAHDRGYVESVLERHDGRPECDRSRRTNDSA